MSLCLYIQGKAKSHLIAEASIRHYILHHIFTQTHNMSYTAKVKTQQFIKRKSNLVKKADQLAWLYHTDLALIIHKNGRYYTYQSNNYDHWFPMIMEIVCEIEHKLLMHWQNCRKNHTLCQLICFPKILTTVTMTAHQIWRRSHCKQSLSWHMQELQRRYKYWIKLCCIALIKSQKSKSIIEHICPSETSI